MAASVVVIAVFGINAGVAQAASPPSTLSFNHSGTKCQGSPNLQTKPLMSQTGIAFDGTDLYISCWGDPTITEIDPTQSPAPEVHVYTISTAPYKAYGALAWDSQSDTLWACGSTYNTGTGSPERNMSEVGTIDLAGQSFSPQFISHGCDNGLAWDPTTNTLWTSGDTATTMYNYSMSGSLLGSKDVTSFLGANAANSGIAIGNGNFYLANPQSTTKRVYSVLHDFSGYADPKEPVLSSTHRYEDMECDDQTYTTTVIWVMWFNQNILKPLPISGTCGASGPPPPGLTITQSNDGPVIAGNNLDFTDTATNTDPLNPQTHLTISQPMPFNASYVSVTSTGGSCSATSTTVSCSFAMLPASQSATMTVTFDPLAPGTVTSQATAQTDQAGPVSKSAPATVNPAAGITYVTVNDSSITGQSQPLNNTVQFTIEGSSAHSIADNNGLGLFSSGLRTPPAAYDWTFEAAGSYSVIDSTTGHTARINVVPESPSTGSVNVPFTVTWAIDTPPAGYVEDIQVQKPGTTKWVAWVSASSAESAQYTPTQTGTYKFRGRFKKTGGGATAYSTGTSTKVS